MDGRIPAFQAVRDEGFAGGVELDPLQDRGQDVRRDPAGRRRQARLHQPQAGPRRGGVPARTVRGCHPRLLLRQAMLELGEPRRGGAGRAASRPAGQVLSAGIARLSQEEAAGDPGPERLRHGLLGLLLQGPVRGL